MGFVNFLTYMKHLGEKALVFFPSKTDLISITDKNGEVTEELLSERLDTLLPKDGDASNVTITFKEATEKANIQSGDSLATAFAKLAKFCSDLEALETNKDRITKGEYRLRIDGSTIIGERKMTETAWATGYSSLGTDSKRFSSVHAGSFHEGGKNISTIYAPINSPTFTGTPKAPTPVATSNDTSLATTAFVKREIGNIIGDAPETLDTLKEVADAIEAHKDVTDALNSAIGNKVSKSGDTMTGTLTAPLFSGPVEARKGGMSVYLSPSGILSDSIQNFCVWNPSSGNNIEIAPMDKSEVKTTLELHNVDNIHDKDKYVKGVIDQSGTKGQKITITYAQDAGITSSNWFPAYDATDPANIKIRPISAANLANKLGVPSYTLLNISSDSSTNFDVTGVKVLKFSGIPLCYFQGFLRATVTKELADAAILFNFENKEFDNYVLENNAFHQVGFINFGTGTRGRLMLQKNNSGYRIRAYSDDGNGITTVANSKLFIKGSFLLL